MTFAEEVLKKYLQAGEIASRVREEIAGQIHAGMPIIEICEKVEELTMKLGGKPAFPCNVSINEVAAHYTSPPGDSRQVPNKALVKVDIGVHVDGYIADTAVTVNLESEHEVLVQAAEAALKRALDSIHAGMRIGKLGTLIERTIKLYGCKPISNLTGHSIDRYRIHAGKSLPNVSHLFSGTISAGEVYAIEPFTTLKAARGRVREAKECTIFRFLRRKSLKDARASTLLDFIFKNYRTLPFAERWLWKRLSPNKYGEAFKRLLASGCIMAYPVFVEESNMPVAQAEHTVIVLENECIVIT
ncbi:MAG TPA: type II methionyl aminopeptidase [Candidatus Bathyarchaeota archaeon]|nr:type II methionyl aminopeptidase [Candidatus Bathyarchaeota archaeon]